RAVAEDEHPLSSIVFNTPKTRAHAPAFLRNPVVALIAPTVRSPRSAVRRTGTGPSVLDARSRHSRQPGNRSRSFTSALIERMGLRLMTSLVSASALFGADDVHWTITGPASVAVDWRGSESTLYFGLTASYGQSVVAVSQAGTTCDPAAVPGNAGTGPYYEARVTGLQSNTVYHYKIGSSGADHTFRTAPPAGGSGFSVMVEGDVGDASSYSNMAAIQGMIAADLPRFVLVVGDLTYKAD